MGLRDPAVPADTTDMVEVIYLLIGGIAVVIIAFIVRAVRLTNATIAEAAHSVPLSQPEALRRVVERLDKLDVRCPRCRHATRMLLGTTNRYACEDDGCEFEFEGPAHIALD
jgi:hypothetical protein